MASSDEEAYGPMLPPGMRAGRSERTELQLNGCSDSNPAAGSSRDEDSTSDTESYGPALPPAKPHPSAAPASTSPDARVLGPSRPSADQLRSASRLVVADGSDEDQSEDEDGGGGGGGSSDSGGEMVGPMPCASEASEKALAESVAADIERRSRAMKRQLDPNRRSPEAREQWMLELPEYGSKQFGLESRQFRRSARPERGDTSCWTSTPSQPHASPAPSSARSSDESEKLALKRRDERIEAAASRLTKPREQSLMDQHRKRLKKDKKSCAETGERRAFDRDRDLGAKEFDRAQKNAAIRRTRGAADMFSSGSQKFL